MLVRSSFSVQITVKCKQVIDFVCVSCVRVCVCVHACVVEARLTLAL